LNWTVAKTENCSVIQYFYFQVEINSCFFCTFVVAFSLSHYQGESKQQTLQPSFGKSAKKQSDTTTERGQESPFNYLLSDLMTIKAQVTATLNRQRKQKKPNPIISFDTSH